MIVAAANPAIDRLLELDRLVIGEIYQPPGALEVAGGKALNVARSAQVLGADVLAVALLGGLNGQRVGAMLEADGVPFDAVQTGGETRQTLAVLARDSGQLTQFYERGTEQAAKGFSRFRERLLERCGPGEWLVLSGSLPAGIDPAITGELAAEGGRLGAHVAVDQHGPWLAAAVGAAPSLIKVNEEEAHKLTGLAPRGAVRELRARAAGARVVVTMGTDGALLLDGSHLWHGVLDVRGAYSTGCGDAFLAGMIASLQAAPDRWVDALALGLAAATANALVPLPARFDVDAAMTLAGEVRLTRV
jgi:1-phosphofructokinase family hexose kinase